MAAQREVQFSTCLGKKQMMYASMGMGAWERDNWKGHLRVKAYRLDYIKKGHRQRMWQRKGINKYHWGMTLETVRNCSRLELQSLFTVAYVPSEAWLIADSQL